jgi:cytoskeletal protein CcmA (bactofilin family)
MSDYLAEDGSFINSIIGEGTAFRGELSLNGLLRIDGDFSGTVRTSGKVLVGKSGRAECTIKAATVVIGGIVKGNIFADDKVIILSTGMMIGNISTPRLIVEEGVIFNGNCLVRKEEKESVEVENAQIEKKHDRLSVGRPQPGTVSSVFATLGKKHEERLLSGNAKGELSTWKG